jgi:4-hydroxy-tetrahydrodipicolinate synthase
MRNGEVDRESLQRLVEFQISEGINGLVPCGTTGEAATLTFEERATVIRTVVEQTRQRVPVIAGAGSNCTRTAIENSKMAKDAGADGLLHVSPYYNKPTAAGLVAHYQAIADAVDLPIVVYNVPSRTGGDLLPETVVQLAKIPGIVGIKEASGSISRGQEVIEACPPQFIVLSGDDANALALTAVGGLGVISVASNVAPGPVARMIALAQEGKLEEARLIHYKLLPLIRLLFIVSNPIPVKAALSLMDLGVNELRLPLVALEGPQLELLREEMKLQELIP